MTAHENLFPAASPPLAPMSLVIPTGLVGPMIKIQAELAASDLIKNRKADAGKKQYGYADLPAVLEHILAVCIRHGVLVTQPPVMESAGEVAIATILAVASGEQLCAVMRYPRNGDVQALGSAVTYLRRYSLLTLFSLAPEEDDDDGKRSVDATRGRAAAPAPAPTQAAPQAAPAASSGVSVDSLRQLFRKRLTEAWPAHAAVLSSDEGAPKVAAIAAAFFKVSPKTMAPADVAEWHKRLTEAPVERIIDRTGAAVAAQFPAPAASATQAEPAAQAPAAPAATAASFEAALLARIKEIPNKFEGFDKDMSDPARRLEILLSCVRALFGQSGADWSLWPAADLAARTVRVANAPIDNLTKKLAPFVCVPF